MRKLSLLLALCALIILGIGTAIAPNSPMFWLATASNGYQYIRAGIGIVLALQLMTNPPRHMAFRIAAGLVSAGIAGWTIQQTMAYQMQLLDMLVLLGSSIIAFATAIERKPAFLAQRTSIPVSYQQ